MVSLCGDKCQRMPYGSNFCHCSVCHLTFTALSSFDKHRKGDDQSRHCLTPEEVGLVPYEKSIGLVYGKPRDPALIIVRGKI